MEMRKRYLDTDRNLYQHKRKEWLAGRLPSEPAFEEEEVVEVEAIEMDEDGNDVITTRRVRASQVATYENVLREAQR